MGQYTVSSSGVDCKSTVFELGWCNPILAHHNQTRTAIISTISAIHAEIRMCLDLGVQCNGSIPVSNTVGEGSNPSTPAMPNQFNGKTEVS